LPATLLENHEQFPFDLLVCIDITMSLSMSRAVLRQSTKLPGRATRRFESTTTKAADAAKEAASKASQTASNFQSKASEGLSKVSSAAGPALSGAAKGVGNALGKIGGRTGKLIAFIERKIIFHNTISQYVWFNC
jgi:F-type H+-transporting ATPase subunit g